MIDFKTAKQILVDNKPTLLKYKVDEIYIFGSISRGDNRKDSDIDLLVKFKSPIGLITFIELKNELSRILNTSVDLVTSDALKPSMKEKILQEAKLVA